MKISKQIKTKIQLIGKKKKINDVHLSPFFLNFHQINNFRMFSNGFFKKKFCLLFNQIQCYLVMNRYDCAPYLNIKLDRFSKCSLAYFEIEKKYILFQLRIMFEMCLVSLTLTGWCPMSDASASDRIGFFDILPNKIKINLNLWIQNKIHWID